MSVFFVILPIIAIAALGWFARRLDLLDESENAALEKVTLLLFMPCLLFLGTARAELPEDMDWHFLLGFYGGVVVMYAAGMLTGRLCFGFSQRQLSAYAMGFSYSNVTVLGIPITLQVLGEQAFLPMFLVIAVHNLFQFTMGALVAELGDVGESGAGHKLLQGAKGLLRNSIIMSLLGGLLWNLLGLPRPDWLFGTLDLLAGAAAPLALFMVGCSLTRYHITGELASSLVMITAKLLVFPALMALIMFRLLDVEPVWAATAVLLCSMPVGISVYVFSRQYRACESQAAAGIVISSLLLVFSLSVVVYGLQHWIAG